MPRIEYKVKLEKLRESDDSVSMVVNYKRVLTRKDTTMRPHEHEYFNSDLFPAMLNAYHAKQTNGKQWARLKDVPPGVTVDTSKFLAVVSMDLPVNFDWRANIAPGCKII